MSRQQKRAHVQAWYPLAVVLCALLGWVVGGSGLAAEDKKPSVTETQALKATNLAQRLELAQLRIQAAQADYEKAFTELQALVQSLQVPGYDFDLQAMLQGRAPYAKREEPAKPAEKETKK